MQTARRVSTFGESVIRLMTRKAMAHGAVNLSQGFPDYEPPIELREAAAKAIMGGHNQYSPSWGEPGLRKRIAELYTPQLGWTVDPDHHVTVTCGVTEAINAATLALLDPGDEIIYFEPAHENYVPSAIFADAKAVPIILEAPDYRLDASRVERAVTPRSRAILLNTPHNPSGRVFDAGELAALAEVIVRHDLVLVTDEIYDRIQYDGLAHIAPGGIEALRDRTVTIGGFGKTYAVTGWRLGYMVAPTRLSRALRPAHDFLTICAPTPLQAAALAALDLPDSFYETMRAEFHERRTVMMEILHEAGFEAHTPEGAYYVLADYAKLPIPQASWDSTRFANWLVEEIGVAVVPGTTFYSLPGYGERTVRFAFAKKIQTLREAQRRMGAMVR